MNLYKFFIVLYLAPALIGCHSNTHEKQYIGYVEAQNTYLAAPYSGTLDTLAIGRGEAVKKGQFLLQLDRNPQAIILEKNAADIAQAQHILQDLINPRRPEEINAIMAQIAQVEAHITLAQLRVTRYQKLFKQNAASKDVLDTTLENLNQQQKLKDQYQANLNLAKHGARDEQIQAQRKQVESLMILQKEMQWELAQKRIVAPDGGIIFDTYFTRGEFVKAGQPVLSLLSPQNLFAVFFVPAQVLGNLKKGQRITLKKAGQGSSKAATIDYISPEAEYLPPLVYSRDNYDKLVFRIKARISDFHDFQPGMPLVVIIP